MRRAAATASSAGPEATVSRQPRLPQRHTAPSARTWTWPISPAMPVTPRCRRPPQHEPGADARGHLDVDDVRPARAPAPRRARPARRGSRRCRPRRACRAARRAPRPRSMPRQPARITDEPTVPVRRSIGPGRPMPAPTTCGGRRRPPEHLGDHLAAVSSECGGRASTSIVEPALGRAPSRTGRRRATRTCRWPKSTPTAAPAVGVEPQQHRRAPVPAAALGPSRRSITSPRACRSPTSVVIVVRESPVIRTRSVRLALPSRRSASTTLSRLGSRSASSDPAVELTAPARSRARARAGLRSGRAPCCR